MTEASRPMVATRSTGSAPLVNGPSPNHAAATTSIARATLNVATSRIGKRTAGQTASGNSTKAARISVRSRGRWLAITTAPARSTAAMSTACASASATAMRGRRSRAQASTSGAKSSTPSASPAHHATPARMTRSDSTSWACASAATPIAAAITGVPSAAGKIRRSTSRTRASPASNRSASSAAGRARSHAAATAASVAPSAITAAVSGGEPSERLARNAPTATPGKSRKPAEHEHGDRDPRRRPDERDVGAEEREHEPELRGAEVGGREDEVGCNVAQDSAHGDGGGVRRPRADAAARPSALLRWSSCRRRLSSRR